eukprot:Skav223696  [mRNA]  locus=scaffold1907:167766:180351:- [translate_table: standard]
MANLWYMICGTNTKSRSERTQPAYMAHAFSSHTRPSRKARAVEPTAAASKGNWTPLAVSPLPSTEHMGCLTFLQMFRSCPVVAETQVKSAKPPQEQFPTPQVGNKGEPAMAPQLPASQSVFRLRPYATGQSTMRKKHHIMHTTKTAPVIGLWILHLAAILSESLSATPKVSTEKPLRPQQRHRKIPSHQPVTIEDKAVSAASADAAPSASVAGP